ncbi:hypothetical protein P4H71_07065 [Paenibacillus kribbensis]|uniref:hypothetical protein n=1 Tax=Paenibacillus kribbensis TaxID=172713 RepID=UPI002DC03491|nr:hypothetical protein [Paenibacillus kribbensis]MEC0234091.1 hypothetical protein [Paenibacillus kribbensis]
MVTKEMDIRETTKSVINCLLSDNPATKISRDEEYYFIYGQLIKRFLARFAGTDVAKNRQHMGTIYQERFVNANDKSAQLHLVESFMKEFANVIDMENRHLCNGLAMFFAYRPERNMQDFGHTYLSYGITAAKTIFIRDAKAIDDFRPHLYFKLD